MKLVCLWDYERDLTKGKTYTGQIVIGEDGKVWFVAFNDAETWHHYDLESFIPRAE